MSERNHTICWECANACGGCSWSEHMNHTPVPGWRATRRDVVTKGGESTESYIVHDCPQFVRDAYENGQKRGKEMKAVCLDCKYAKDKAGKSCYCTKFGIIIGYSKIACAFHKERGADREQIPQRKDGN